MIDTPMKYNYHHWCAMRIFLWYCGSTSDPRPGSSPTLLSGVWLTGGRGSAQSLLNSSTTAADGLLEGAGHRHTPGSTLSSILIFVWRTTENGRLEAVGGVGRVGGEEKEEEEKEEEEEESFGVPRVQWPCVRRRVRQAAGGTTGSDAWSGSTAYATRVQC